MTGQMTGTGKLLRLALRLDRVRLPIWIVLLAVMPAATAAQYKTLYPTEATLQAVTGVISNPSLVAINGPLFKVTLGALTAWKIGATELILVGLMSIFTVVRHSRAEEEAGRLELIGAGVVGRRAPLTAALAIAALANLAVTVFITLFLIGAGMPAGGSVAFGLAIGLTGLAFTAVAGLAAQLTESARSAHGIAFAVLGAAYVLRALGDTGPVALTWISPVGWAMRVRAFGDERWWVLALPLALTILGVGAAYALVARRDLGAGLLRERRGPAVAPVYLGGPFGLAWRLHRGILLGWLIGLAAGGATMGGAAAGISGAVIDNKQVTDMLARLGGTSGLLDAYLAAVFGIIGLCVAAYTVQATLRMRAEESSGPVGDRSRHSGRADPVGVQPPRVRARRFRADPRGDRRGRRPHLRPADPRRRRPGSAAGRRRARPGAGRVGADRARCGRDRAGAAAVGADLGRAGRLRRPARARRHPRPQPADHRHLAVRARAEAARQRVDGDTTDLARRGRRRPDGRRPGRIPPAGPGVLNQNSAGRPPSSPLAALAGGGLDCLL